MTEILRNVSAFSVIWDLSSSQSFFRSKIPISVGLFFHRCLMWRYHFPWNVFVVTFKSLLSLIGHRASFFLLKAWSIWFLHSSWHSQALVPRKICFCRSPSLITMPKHLLWSPWWQVMNCWKCTFLYTRYRSRDPEKGTPDWLRDQWRIIPA